MHELPIQSTTVLDAFPLASRIEMMLGEYLVPYEPTILSKGERHIHMPVQGVEIMRVYIEKIINDCCIWSKRGSKSLEEIWGQFIRPEYSTVSEQYRYEHDIPSVIEAIKTILYDLRTDIIQLVTTKSWDIYFVETKGMSIYINKSIDYRIHVFEKEHRHKYPR